jgi:hypothetical protein
MNNLTLSPHRRSLSGNLWTDSNKSIHYKISRETVHCDSSSYRGADKSLARPGREQATATEDFEFRTSYL